MRRNGRDCVSAEWVYHFVRLDRERGGRLYTYLPHHLKHRRRPVSARLPIRDRVSIDERPAVVDAKARFGDWEMDTIVGKDGKGAIVTLVERTTKKMLMAKSPKGKNAKAIARLVVRMLRPFVHHVLSITTDNGTDFSSLSDDYILHVQTEINLRPRKLLNLSSPKQKFLLSLHNSVALGS